MADEFIPQTREYNLGGPGGGPAGRSVGFWEAVKSALSKYATFSGRAQRAEYWWFFLFTLIGGMVTGVIDAMIFGWEADDPEILNSVFSFAMFVPGLAVGWRRMHDVGRSGWWFLLPYGALFFAVIALATVGFSGEGGGSGVAIVAVVLVLLTLAAGIYILVLLCTDSERHTNDYGPSPKYGSQADIFS